MNVMAQAHKATREVLQSAGCKGLNYASLFRAALKDFHRINKEAMKPQVKEAIDQMNARIAELRALPTEGYIQVLGSARIVINAEVGCLSNIKNCPVYANKEDASFYNGRIVNGKGETNRYVSKADQIRFMIIQCKEAIQGLMAQ